LGAPHTSKQNPAQGEKLSGPWVFLAGDVFYIFSLLMQNLL
jgi:hypothetical protein